MLCTETDVWNKQAATELYVDHFA